MIESNRVSGDPLAKAVSQGVKRGEGQENREAWKAVFFRGLALSC